MMFERAPDHSDKGLYSRRLTKSDFVGRPCLFLDRDGVIVEEINYLHRAEDVRMIPGVAAAIAKANASQIPVVLVTNQAGIGRGYYDWRHFVDVQEAIIAFLRKEGAFFDMVLACAYHADGKGPLALGNHPWRKPNPGMLLEAAAELRIDRSRSTIIGDCRTDLAAGRSAGLRRGALVLTGHGRKEERLIAEDPIEDFDASVFESAAPAIASWLISFPRNADVSE